MQRCSRPTSTLAALVAGFLATGTDARSQGADTGAKPVPLKDAAAGRFTVGVGVNDRIPERPGDHPLLLRHFAAVTPENSMKPAAVQPGPGGFRFDVPDAFVEFATGHGLAVVGHCLVWAKDDRTPPWFFEGEGGNNAGPASGEVLLERMRRYIAEVAGRYRGKIAMWDVVNEALADGDGGYLRESGWTAACGESFIAEAFKAARAADPDALLIYNDYNNEFPAKREKMVRLIRSLQEAGAPVEAIGLQGHYEIDRIPFDEIEATLEVARELGVQVVVSELDIDVIPRGRWWADGGAHREEMAKIDPYRDACPPDVLARQAEQYARLFEIFNRHADVIARVSFWNLHDGHSWLNDFPWRRVNHPLLFDRDGNPKPAFDAVVEALGDE